jgi:2-dehydro-3-deoxyphosphogluconate aldolase / (4S)-4-hydroxy-2-oxoglutarate aldolase
MSKAETLKKLVENGVFAVIRMTDSKKLLKVIEAVSKGGVKNIEITMTVPNAVEIIRELAKANSGDSIIGAGTVLTKEDAKAVIEAGAQFVVSPIMNPEVIATCKELDIPCMPGCYTPTEVIAGWKAGGDIIKVFPATTLGPRYFKDLLAPFPYLKLMPTGGVSINNVHEWVNAGALTVAIGGDLLDKKVIADENWDALTARAQTLTDNFKNAKKALKG